MPTEKKNQKSKMKIKRKRVTRNSTEAGFVNQDPTVHNLDTNGGIEVRL